MSMERWDIIIIGGGPAGLTAGLYAARGGMKTLLLEKITPGGQAATTERIENYPGFPQGIGGLELTERIREQSLRFGLKIKSEEVIEIQNLNQELRGNHESTRMETDRSQMSDVRRGQGFKAIKTKDKTYKSLAVIVASGAEAKKLGVPGEEELRGRGVSYCATCDGPLFRNQDIIVIGGGDRAVEEALFLTKFAKKVILIHRRDRLRATKILEERVLSNPKVEFIWQSVVTRILGDKRVEGVKVKNIKSREEKELKAKGIFILVGIKPETEFLKGVLEMDKDGYIITDENMKTSEEGIYACGDARKKLLRQVVTACGEGALAAFATQQYVEELKGTAYK